MFLVKVLEHVHVQTPSSQGFQSARKQRTAPREAQLPGTTASLVGGGEGLRAGYTRACIKSVYTCVQVADVSARVSGVYKHD